jgi:hypothetical protein
MRSVIIFLASFLLITNNCLGGIKPIKRNLFIISIGIDDYKKPFYDLLSCKQDANRFIDKLKSDYNKLYEGNEDQKGEVISFLLADKDANRDSIKKVFEYISKNSSPDDYFVFTLASFTWESITGETFIIPYMKKEADTIPVLLNDSVSISLNTLGKWANSIQCNNQLFISESGSGQPFATNLINNLFESNMLIASQSKRNRIIITTKGYGFEVFQCKGEKQETGGILCHFLQNVNNILDIFQNQGKVEYEIMKAEVECDPFKGQKIYSVIYKESDFSKLLSNKYQSRGITLSPNAIGEEQNKSTEIKNYAIFIGTNEYTGKPDWSNLKNPVGDAQAVQTILKSKYNFEVKSLYNMPLDSVIMAIIDFKKNIGVNDNVLLFISGHGYYDKDYSDCFIVFKDSKPLNEDFRRNTYLQMATLNRVLDNYPNKHLFVIFDICFGAYFDMNAKDLSLSDYKESTMDISTDELIKRKSDFTSRIYLSSGKGEVPDYWTNSMNHSPFATKLIAVLENERSFLTPGKIYKTLEGNITEPVLKYFGKHETRGDFIMKVK